MSGTILNKINIGKPRRIFTITMVTNHQVSETLGNGNVKFVSARHWLKKKNYIDGSMQDCSNSSALPLKLPQYCAKPSICMIDKLVKSTIQSSNQTELGIKTNGFVQKDYSTAFKCDEVIYLSVLNPGPPLPFNLRHGQKITSHIKLWCIITHPCPYNFNMMA